MPAHQLVPAMTAGTVTALVLLLRWAVTRSRARRQGASSARPPWRRTTPPHGSAAPSSDPAGPVPQPDAVLREAEEHVHQYWQRLRSQPPPHD
ncbi:hypothetical protein RI578_39250 [Streptomyces sp. BB1-1-1]|uniref:hypothetical protein n=1 Tax=Streptomyces sp. BB1-1-1 TaxID=3074430 RepID=UPI002877B7D2|nr:hypothetical protein [Streptomyces sp. BB1-1-1]WND39947.1 hypothetical protein RI578_39250 [Streptomyces sp. BB1-1-1]